MKKVNIYGQKSHQVKAEKRVSVIIPNYNYEDFISERIDSVVMQTYPISELIVLDDASKDKSPKIIEEKLKDINQKYPNIKTRFIKNAKNSGGCVFSQWQKGLSVATGDYFWIAEADDSCDARFLETAMSKMEKDNNIKLFFSDSYRINQDNIIKSKTCTDWADMWRSGHWKKDYVANGLDELVNYLSGQIYIMNVSSVVWKNEKRCMSIFKEAEKYKIAGDWYIYSRIMEEGKIAYSAKPYNYYRKHDKGSASTVINRLVEYEEVISVQDRIKDKYGLNEEQIKWQMVRRRGMGFTTNEENKGDKGRIAWLVPWFSEGSGGHRTIFQNVNRLVDYGYKCDIYVESLTNEPATAIYDRLVAGYGKFKGDVFSGFDMVRDYDMVIATGWNTAEPVSKTSAKHKAYFIQDFEPWFFSMGGEYLTAENSYSLGLKGVTIGKWLSNKMRTEYNMPTGCFDFCADLDIYHPIDTKKENALCLIFQPGKPRRADTIALRAMQIVQKLRPDTKIYLYGSAQRDIKGLKVEHMGTVTPKKCNELYNKCSVGVCMSASNPSRIPFEMMAAGLPVVELYKENNLYDLPDEACMLAEPNPAAIATAIIKLLDDKTLREKMGKAGQKFMADRPLEKGYQQFLKFVDDEFANKKQEVASIPKSYKSTPIAASKEALNADLEIKEKVSYGAPKVMGEVKQAFSRRGINKAKRLVKKTIRFIREA